MFAVDLMIFGEATSDNLETTKKILVSPFQLVGIGDLTFLSHPFISLKNIPDHVQRASMGILSVQIMNKGEYYLRATLFTSSQKMHNKLRG